MVVQCCVLSSALGLKISLNPLILPKNIGGILPVFNLVSQGRTHLDFLETVYQAVIYSVFSKCKNSEYEHAQ